eukprot:ANDGO_07039.mRNA.1 Small nuclear ribonucleoprotein Sm D-like protein
MDKLDLTSSECDFLQCLREPDAARVHVPNRAVAPLDNLSKCRMLLPPSDPNRIDGAASVAKTEYLESAEFQNRVEHAKAYQEEQTRRRIQKEKEAEERLRNQPTAWNSFGKLVHDKSAKARDALGPFVLLQECVRGKKQVCVKIRKVDRLFGSIVGYLEAFDKHCNLILRNCVQQYTDNVPEHPHQPEGKKLLKNIQRNLSWVFLKGDTVCSVIVLPD